MQMLVCNTRRSGQACGTLDCRLNWCSNSDPEDRPSGVRKTLPHFRSAVPAPRSGVFKGCLIDVPPPPDLKPFEILIEGQYEHSGSIYQCSRQNRLLELGRAATVFLSEFSLLATNQTSPGAARRCARIWTGVSSSAPMPGRVGRFVCSALLPAGAREWRPCGCGFKASDCVLCACVVFCRR